MIRSFSFTALAVLGFSYLAASQATATSTLQFSNVGRLTGFSAFGDLDGTDLLRWGIVIDTNNNGFADLTTPTDKYDAFNNGVSGFLSIGSVVTDDYFHAGALPVTSTLGPLGLDPGGPGGVVSMTTVPNGDDSGVDVFDTGDDFAIIWFDGASVDGNYYGIFRTNNFDLPPSGTVSYSAQFNNVAAEPIKQANIQFGAALIPEPSRLMLLGFGLIGIFARRRRI
jgi:PEP-CTERM motif